MFPPKRVEAVTGPEHYREAERLINGIKANPDPISVTEALTDHNTVLAASVHATLALAAATAAHQANIYDGDENSSRTRGWAGVV